MSATWTSRLEEFKRLDAAAQQAALVECAWILTLAMRDVLRGGYKTGAFATGRVAASVDFGEPYLVGPTQWAIQIGTDNPVALFWEFGHRSKWTEQYERVEKWRPTLLELRVTIARKFAEVYKREMSKAP